MNKKNKILTFIYQFQFDDNREEIFKIVLQNLKYLHNENLPPPKWTKLEYKQCKNCKLTTRDNTYCPLALGLSNIIAIFKNTVSYQPVLVKVKTEDRQYEAKTTVHQGLSSLIGILMVTTGCPKMNLLRPMVRFHLPFASVEETITRSVGSYLLMQYFRYRKGLHPDINLTGLLKVYKEIQQVNVGIAKRLSGISLQDANINAVVLLDIFAKELPETIVERLKDIEYLYTDVVS